jgi:hypothetical protein
MMILIWSPILYDSFLSEAIWVEAVSVVHKENEKSSFNNASSI